MCQGCSHTQLTSSTRQSFRPCYRQNGEGDTAADLASGDKAEAKRIANILAGKEPLAPVAEIAA